MPPLLKRTTFEPHPAGLTIGTLVEVTLDENGTYGPQFMWKFDTEELMEDERPFRISYWTGLTLNEKSNLQKLLIAFGEDPADERWDELEGVEDFDDLLNRKVQLNVIHKKKGDSIQSRVDSVLPLPKRRERTARLEAREERPAREEREPVGAGARGGGKEKWDEGE